ncbi:ImmA/IrrE family metallo-endopeptidase [Ornithinimicrobium sp. F0845]|uniref:ImmA/IrrE family metallo-endopeptidase n=1 Tax=Ornithinimicrobium sp. F0845 TaxID=2926412 RepID=UPI001FF37074|nr:ImmA/IrrE family metallo-endopeptidase [Ornithinimicrobium sp. F0845]MCK0114019.1 ImmA/IrrE family metallo-endopeptidase [Ornithinimicrobium sp. F0845]
MAAYAIESGAASDVDDLLDQVAAVRGRRLFNALLAILQMPHATMLCDAAEWRRKWRRAVRPGERPVVLLFPFGPVEFVFDVSQTEATDHQVVLPFDAAPFEMRPFPPAAELLARLISAVAPIGVRVLTARHGVPLAGKIQRIGDTSGTPILQFGDAESREAAAERWVVTLNQSHAPTEQLATLAHELGHLFCGHVGADRGDKWPNRPVADRAVREFEAESVARLLFRKVAPGWELPDYLDRTVELDHLSPENGLTYVAQAAETVLDLLDLQDRPIRGSMEVKAAPVEVPAWATSLEVRQGAENSTEVILVRSTPDHHGLPERVATAWAAGTSTLADPWIATARTVEAFDGVLSYFARPPGADADHDRSASRVLQLLPLDSHRLTVVSAGEADQGAVIEVSTDESNHGSDLVAICRSHIQGGGLECIEPDLDLSWLNTRVEYATGEHGWEQVLGWEEVFGTDDWRFRSSSERLFLNVRPDAGLVEPQVIEILARAVSTARIDFADYEASQGDDSYSDQ